MMNLFAHVSAVNLEMMFNLQNTIIIYNIMYLFVNILKDISIQ